jgi:L-ascorbate metabolism protein UlaG (beta-lactamase superfamily)
MAAVHMNPDEAVRAHLAVGAKLSLASHHGTFRLTDEGIDAPVNDLAAARKTHELPAAAFVAPGFGETVIAPLS